MQNVGGGMWIRCSIHEKAWGSPHSTVGAAWANVAIYLLPFHWEFPLLSHAVLCWKTGYSVFCRGTVTYISVVVTDEPAPLSSPCEGDEV